MFSPVHLNLERRKFLSLFLDWTLQTETWEADFGKNSYFWLPWSAGPRFGGSLQGKWDVPGIPSELPKL